MADIHINVSTQAVGKGMLSRTNCMTTRGRKDTRRLRRRLGEVEAQGLLYRLNHLPHETDIRCLSFAALNPVHDGAENVDVK